MGRYVHWLQCFDYSAELLLGFFLFYLRCLIFTVLWTLQLFSQTVPDVLLTGPVIFLSVLDNKVSTALPVAADVEGSSAQPGSHLYLLCLWEIFWSVLAHGNIYLKIFKNNLWGAIPALVVRLCGLCLELLPHHCSSQPKHAHFICF